MQFPDDKYIQREFDSIDKGKTGRISTADFRSLVFDNESLQGFRSAAIDKYISELSDNTGWITFEQFKKFMRAETSNFDNPIVIAELKEAFNEVDSNKDGLISQREARHGITLCGERIPGFCFDDMRERFDDNGDGLLSFDEFLNNLKKTVQD
ncbi:unnamed protein product [Adineta steineri]|uniref:EF-hand domain-containing protein n=1 Tax=Adineta steineri TaxID=433720 RepID=A0A816CRH7_9BILA|nr:unnamed protein product [Adineta steineri]CAF1183075.1 unnamed protein product [Adineta steineri]CAF1439066.1 unnamed protein product [Adineta steineri]CAF1627028.1 unnamed protein product [Adineta steineri]